MRLSSSFGHLLVSRLAFIFNYPTSSNLSTLSLHDALPIFERVEDAGRGVRPGGLEPGCEEPGGVEDETDRKSTRLNSSHRCISYAVFCLKKKITSGAMGMNSSSATCDAVGAAMIVGGYD